MPDLAGNPVRDLGCPSWPQSLIHLTSPFAWPTRVCPCERLPAPCRIPSSDLREQLHEALSDGRLLELPTDDWPPGCPRDQRALQISRMVRENREALHLVAMQLFGLHPERRPGAGEAVGDRATSAGKRCIWRLSRTSDPVSDIKIVDVAICSLRKRLEKFGIEIVTLWAYGFQLSSEHRRRAMDLILGCRGAPG